MPVHNNHDSGYIYVYEGENLNIGDMLRSIKFSESFQTSEYNLEFFKTTYGITNSYWQNLNIMYHLINDTEIRNFLIRTGDDLKILLLYIPIFVQKYFYDDKISLELVQDPDTGKSLLRSYIHTKLSAQEATRKLSKIDDLSAKLETSNTLDNFLLNVEFE